MASFDSQPRSTAAGGAPRRFAALLLLLTSSFACESERLAPQEPLESEPTSPWELELVGRLPIGGGPSALTVVGPIAYIATRENGIQVIDITVPESPEILTTIRDVAADRIAFSEDRLFALERGRSLLGLSPGGRLATYDVLDPKQPVALEARPIEQASDVAAYAARSVVGAGRRILVGAEGAKPLAIDAARGDRERVIATAWRGNRIAIAVLRDAAWFATSTAEFIVFEGKRPVKVGSLSLPATFSAAAPNAWHIELTAQSAWLSGSDRLIEIDLGDPKAPTIRHDLSVPGLQGVALSSDHVAILGAEFRLHRRSDFGRVPLRGVLPGRGAIAATLHQNTLVVLDSERGLSVLRLTNSPPRDEDPAR